MLQKIVKALSDELHSTFCKWLKSLEVPSSHDVKDSHLRIIPLATFLNFNYTDSLERIYGIPVSQILYIHGKIDRDDSQIVIGHRGTNESASNEIDWESTDTRIADGNQILDEYFVNTSKPVDKILRDQEVFFRSQGDTKNVIVLGHSLGEVDFPYFEAIASHVSASATWSFSWHSDDDKQRIQGLTNRLAIAADRLRIFRLEEITTSDEINNSLSQKSGVISRATENWLKEPGDVS